MKRKIGLCILAVVLVLGVIGTLMIRKDININPILADTYEIHGVDVSHYQGEIDWIKIEEQDLDFAMIKATEGSGHLDECFHDNWQAAAETGLCIGAYHFFSFDSKGETQADFYIDMVGDLNGRLAPVIDVEYYGDKRSNPPDKSEVTQNLGAMLDALEQHYQVKPIIYTTYTIYKDYIKGEFSGYPLWVRSIYCPPTVLFGSEWCFWQYMDDAVLEGYEGDEEHIDMNVFRGTRKELEELLVSNGSDRSANVQH